MANRFDTRELSRLFSMREKKGQVEKGTGHVVTPAPIRLTPYSLPRITLSFPFGGAYWGQLNFL